MAPVGHNPGHALVVETPLVGKATPVSHGAAAAEDSLLIRPIVLRAGRLVALGQQLLVYVGQAVLSSQGQVGRPRRLLDTLTQRAEGRSKGKAGTAVASLAVSRQAVLTQSGSSTRRTRPATDGVLVKGPVSARISTVLLSPVTAVRPPAPVVALRRVPVSVGLEVQRRHTAHGFGPETSSRRTVRR